MSECVTYDAVFWYFFVRCLIPFIGLSGLAVWLLYDRGKQLEKQRQEHYGEFVKKREENEKQIRLVKERLFKKDGKK